MTEIRRKTLTRNKLRLPSTPNARSSTLCLSKLCDSSDFHDPLFWDLAAEILGGKAQAHRKLWEFTQLVRSLDAYELLNKESVGISIAAGHERVLYYLANKVGRLVATDIYGDGDFSKDEADVSALIDISKYSPYPYDAKALSVLYMDGCHLAFDDGSLNFAFCLSSIEHFGGIKAARRCITEMSRVVRPGGLVFVTTECALNGFCTDEVFTPSEIEILFADCGLEILPSIDWKLSDETFSHLIDMRSESLETIPHINLKHFSSIFTSISIAARKTGNPLGPVNLSKFDESLARIRSAPLQASPLTFKKRKPSFFEKCRWRIEEALLM